MSLILFLCLQIWTYHFTSDIINMDLMNILTNFSPFNYLWLLIYHFSSLMDYKCNEGRDYACIVHVCTLVVPTLQSGLWHMLIKLSLDSWGWSVSLCEWTFMTLAHPSNAGGMIRPSPGPSIDIGNGLLLAKNSMCKKYQLQVPSPRWDDLGSCLPQDCPPTGAPYWD